MFCFFIIYIFLLNLYDITERNLCQRCFLFYFLSQLLKTIELVNSKKKNLHQRYLEDNTCKYILWIQLNAHYCYRYFVLCTMLYVSNRAWLLTNWLLNCLGVGDVTKMFQWQWHTSPNIVDMKSLHMIWYIYIWYFSTFECNIKTFSMGVNNN